MPTIRRLALHAFPLVLATLATAQAVDAPATPAPGNAGFGAHRPASTPGAPKLQLWDNGTYITQTGVGAGGADVSEIEPGLGLFGLGHQFSLGYRVANDFGVPGGQSWSLSGLRWVAYQTNATTAGSITGIYTEYTSGSPNGAVIGGDSTTNELVSSVWTGVYRVTSTTLQNNQRALIEVTASIPNSLGALGPGSYWIRVMCDGSLTSGPWCPVTVPWDGFDNAQQELGIGSGFNPTTQGFGGAPVDNVFWLDGTTSLSGGLVTYCTSKPSSLGCAPVVTGSGMPDCTAGSGFVLQCAPVPGGPSPGILIYTTNGPLANAITGPFGFLCITPGSGLIRVLPPVFPGGTFGVCNGAYSLDFNQFFATQTVDPNLVCGSQVDAQFWYRDAPNPGSANFSQAVGFSMQGGLPLSAGISGFVPTSGGEGTVLTVTGNGFGFDPNNLRLLLADGIGFADVTAAGGNVLTAVVFAVGNTGTGPITLLRGGGLSLPDSTINVLGISSTMRLIRLLVNADGTNSAGQYTLSPASPNTVSSSSGTPLPGPVTVNLNSLAGNAMTYELAFELSSGEFRQFEGRIDFTGLPNANQRAAHLAQHLNDNFSDQGVNATASGTTVRATMGGATYGGMVVHGI